MVSAYLVCIFHILHLMKKAIACALLHQHPRDHRDLLKPVLSLALCQETALGAGCSFPLPYTREASETLGASACSTPPCRRPTSSMQGIATRACKSTSLSSSFWWKSADLGCTAGTHLHHPASGTRLAAAIASYSPLPAQGFVKRYQTGQACFNKGCSVPGIESSVHRGFSQAAP